MNTRVKKRLLTQFSPLIKIFNRGFGSQLLSVILLSGLLFTPLSMAHGLTGTTATIQLQPNNIVSVSVSFDLVDLLNHRKNQYDLSLLASLNEEDFSTLYSEIKKLFENKLKLTVGKNQQRFKTHYPSSAHVQQLLKAQFIAQKMTQNNTTVLYTQNDRKFYNTFYFDSKLANATAINQVNITFPKPLGDIYTTFSQPKTKHLKSGDVWNTNN